ncbi:helix-turn-helix transcriptional regulator [Phocaeicola plebeius]|jgi:phage repressor protein C with HTH and peptisase S24 domain|uniref:S24 family peptidase n=1 Tax=Phocaeicola plebeius TaxID=310297 RepID=UPI0026F1ACC4|nr:S24 family peptidase [Phocaeicola plebeius]MCI6049744.1 S24 family peptidase [Phocaeicola plebeius]MDD6914080.1 S24 family peptidase [Phocaeicola plebeius]MDY5979503.1 S24 family peptidase [Phocaeicola plebeius]
MTGQEIINKVLEELNLKAPTFAESIGVKYQRIFDLQKGKVKKISSSLANDIISKYGQFNLTWLLTGEGEMLNTPNQTSDEASPIDEPIILRVPLVSQYAQAGYLCGYADAAYMATLPTIPYIVDHEAQGHYVAFEVKGDSMNDGTEDAILEGDRLLCREIMPHLWADSKLHIRKWDFVIVHTEGILVKRIINHDVENHTITIHSLNSMYPDKVINLSDVKQIFNVIELQRPRRR